MKLILSTTSPHIDSAIDPRFGRAAHFLIVDSETLEWKAVPNPAIHSSGGAGIQAAQLVSDQGCQAVISGDFGPNAYNALYAAGVQIYLFGSCQTARQAIQQFKVGQLQQVHTPGKAGHKGQH